MQAIKRFLGMPNADGVGVPGLELFSSPSTLEMPNFVIHSVDNQTLLGFWQAWVLAFIVLTISKRVS